MVINKNITKASFLLAFVFQINFAQQTTRNDLSSFEGFKKVGFHLSGVFYKKADIDRKYGNYELITNPTLSGRIGFDYAFNHQKNWSYRTGLYLDLIPSYNLEFEIKPEDLAFITWDLDGSLDTKEKGNTFVFTIPFLVEGKLQMSEKLFFSAMGGFDFSVIRSSAISFGVGYSDDEVNESREIFALYGESSGFFIYPSLRLSPGLYFVTEKALYQIQLTYKKSLVPYFKGEYQFGNLDVSEPTRGDYTFTGDFMALGLTVFLKKKKKKKKYNN